jgi:Alpha-L-arabinofuranosidase B (ABFB) domain
MTSYRSLNFPDRYIRHRNFLAFIDPIGAHDGVGRQDGTFEVISGLAGLIDPQLAGRCSSFRSVNFPHHFLRHQDFRLKLAEQSDDELFRRDASFIVVPGLFSNQGVSFEAVNFRRHFIRHSNFELFLHESDGNLLFRKDATFIESPNLVEHGPSVIID